MRYNGCMSRPKQYTVSLTDAERTVLTAITKNYRYSERERNRAQILLLSEQNISDTKIAEQVGCHAMTVRNARLRFCSQNQNLTEPLPTKSVKQRIKRAEQINRPQRVFDGEKEAQLIAVVCSTPPDGAKQWTLELLHEKVIALKIVEKVAKETIRQTLKKTNLSRSVKTSFDLSKRNVGAFLQSTMPVS